MIALIVVLIIIAILVIAVIVLYNNLVQLRNRVDNAWSQIDVQLQRRLDLIPNLVETVKGYASHERGTFEAVTQARNAVMAASTPEAKMEADNVLTGTLKSLFAVAEAYPDLKANTNFQQLQAELTNTEDKISYMRQSYNDTVLNYNNAIQTFPGNILAGMFNFTKRDGFDANAQPQAHPLSHSIRATQKACRPSTLPLHPRPSTSAASRFQGIDDKLPGRSSSIESRNSSEGFEPLFFELTEIPLELGDTL